MAVSGGPGSYTGLRVGVSMAKGICYGRGVKLLAVPTLELLAVPVLLHHEEIEENALLVPMIDARRMEVYSAVYDRALKEVRGIQADVVDENTYKEYLDRGPVYFFGNGAEKCMETINHPNAHLIKGIEFGSIFSKLIIQIRKLLFLNRIQGQVDLGFFAFMVTALKRAFKRRLLAGRQAV